MIEAQTQLADAKLRASTFLTEKADLEEELARLERRVKSSDKIIADLAKDTEAPKSPEQWLLRLKLDEAQLEKDNAVGRRSPVQQRLEGGEAADRRSGPSW